MNLGRTKAKEIISKYNIDSANILNYLEDLCWDLGVVVREAPIAGSDARITIKDNFGVITISSYESYETKKRFSIGHELGHFLLHKKCSSSIFCSSEQMRSWFGKQQQILREIEANEFCSELLMPEKFFMPIITNKKPNFKLFEEVTEQFQSSLTSTILRYIELTDEAVAIVFYNKSGIKWFKRSSYFEEQKYWIQHGKIDEYSLAYDALKNKAPSGMEAVDVTAWLDLDGWRLEKYKDELIMEQTRYFSNIDFGISILWINNPKLIWN